MVVVLVIDRIEADPDSTIPVDHYGGPYKQSVIWPLASFNDTVPTVLRLSEPRQITDLMVTFTLTYNQQPWTRPGLQYTLKGHGPNGTVIQSEAAKLPESNTPTRAWNFRIIEPYGATVAFSEGKPWRWSICHWAPIGISNTVPPVDVFSRTRTRLELYFYAGGMEELFFTGGRGVDVRLLRLVVPPRNIVYTPRLNLPALYRWLVERIWNHGSDVIPRLQYDTFDGESYFVLPLDDDSDCFDLDGWFEKTWHLCNCLDIAVFISLACRALGTVDGESIVKPDIVFGEPWGYIRPGLLFGLPLHRNCNNPFFRADADEATLDQFDEDREGFPLHYWVEVPLKGNDVVLDACYCLGRAPAGLGIGTRDRIQHHLDATETGPPNDLYEKRPHFATGAWNITILVDLESPIPTPDSTSS